MDLLIESKVFSPNAAKVIMMGKNHKRCSLAHKLKHEVMSRMQWAAFLEWTVSKKLISKKEASKLETLANQSQKELENLLDHKKMDKSKHETFRQSSEEMHKHLLTYQDMFDKVIETGIAHSMKFHLWNEYIIDVEIAFDYIYVEKAPNWNMHISALLKCCVMHLHMTIKIILACGPVYIAEMWLLPETAPEVNTKFQEGEHVVKRSEIHHLTRCGLISNWKNQLLKIRNRERKVQ